MANNERPQEEANTDLKFRRVTESEIKCLVDQFYAKVRTDPELAPIFNRAIRGDDWEPHLAIMRSFWSSVMLTSGRYKGNPVAKHLPLVGMQPSLFDHWLDLFSRTCHELFVDDLAAEFIVKAQRIAESLKLALFYRPDRPWPSSPG
jgi:hemoglobin